MTRYHFDMRHADGVAVDEEGMELPSAEDAWVEAAHAVAELAVDALPDRAEHGSQYQMQVEVRDGGGAVLVVKICFETMRRRLDAQAVAETDADRYRREAEECRKLAARAISQPDKDAWLGLAADWMKLAENAAECRQQWLRNK